MKKIFFVLVFISTVSSVTAQNNIIGFDLTLYLNRVKIKYERVLSDRYTIGSQSTIFYGWFPGFQLAPIGRMYFKKDAPEGFYAQGKICMGIFQSGHQSVVSGEEKTQIFSNFGAGFAFGYQWLLGDNKQWSVDLSLGLKFVGSVPIYGSMGNSWDELLNAWHTIPGNTAWRLFGPGSFVDTLFTVGYRF